MDIKNLFYLIQLGSQNRRGIELDTPARSISISLGEYKGHSIKYITGISNEPSYVSVLSKQGLKNYYPNDLMATKLAGYRELTDLEKEILIRAFSLGLVKKP